MNGLNWAVDPENIVYEAVLLLDLVTRLDGANRSDAADVGDFL